MQASRMKWMTTALLVSGVAVCVAALWWTALAPRSWSGADPKLVAFRDAAHFYYPLHQRLKASWQRGVFPVPDSVLPESITTESIVANPTSGVFYPPAWLCFGLLPTPLDEHLFLIGHVLLAVWTTWRLARSLGCSSPAATLAGLTYALSGSVMFQQYNIIFLVGAAWFPEGVRLVRRLRQRGRIRDAATLGVVVALVILGGDWQATCHLGLFGVAVLVAALLARRTPHILRRRTATLLALGFLIAMALAAVQIVPSLRAIRNSDRGTATHTARVDHYSLPLFRLVECVYPNFSGVQFPQHMRWTLAAESRGIWTPSLYAGILPAILAMASLRFWGNRRLVVLTWCLVFALTASLGSAGGLYTLLASLPLYDLFRYPAKWLTVAALPMAILAAHGLDSLAHEWRSVRRIALTTGVVVAVLMVAVPSLWCHGAPPACPLFGPFQAEAAYNVFIACGAWACGLLLVTASLVRFTQGKYAPAVVVFVLVATGIDLVAMNAPLVRTVPLAAFDSAQAAPLVDALRMHHTKPRPPRLFRAVSYDPAWKTTSSPCRLETWIRRDVATLAPRYHWLLLSENTAHADAIDVVPVSGTMLPQRLRTLLVANRAGLFIPRDWESVRALEIDFFLLDETGSTDGVRSPIPAAWFAHLERVAVPLPRGVALWRVRE